MCRFLFLFWITHQFLNKSIRNTFIKIHESSSWLDRYCRFHSKCWCSEDIKTQILFNVFTSKVRTILRVKWLRFSMRFIKIDCIFFVLFSKYQFKIKIVACPRNSIQFTYKKCWNEPKKKKRTEWKKAFSAYVNHSNCFSKEKTFNSFRPIYFDGIKWKIKYQYYHRSNMKQKSWKQSQYWFLLLLLCSSVCVCSIALYSDDQIDAIEKSFNIKS